LVKNPRLRHGLKCGLDKPGAKAGRHSPSFPGRALRDRQKGNGFASARRSHTTSNPRTTFRHRHTLLPHRSQRHLRRYHHDGRHPPHGCHNAGTHTGGYIPERNTRTTTRHRTRSTLFCPPRHLRHPPARREASSVRLPQRWHAHGRLHSSATRATRNHTSRDAPNAAVSLGLPRVLTQQPQNPVSPSTADRREPRTLQPDAFMLVVLKSM
jgi:hypothetical protein